MATAHDIVKRALQLSGVVAIGQQPDAEEAATALDALNMMIHGWAINGADTEHTDLALTDDFPLAASFQEGTVYLLSARLNVTYQLPTQFDPDLFMDAIQAAYCSIDEVTLPTTLTDLPSQLRYAWEVSDA